MITDPDKPDPRMVNELALQYEEAAKRLRDQITNPPGATTSARKWNQARASSLLAQVDRQIDKLKTGATKWTGDALQRSMTQGIRVADNPEWSGWRSVEKEIARLSREGQISSGHPLHAVFHESGHAHMKSLGVHFGGRSLNPDDKVVASRVSRRATVDMDEFMAELRAGRMAGQRFDQNVMKLYERLGGR